MAASKRARRSTEDLQPTNIRQKYLASLDASKYIEPIIIESPGDWYPTTCLECWMITEDDLAARCLRIPDHFSWSGDKWQYDIGKVAGKRERPAAYRVPFYGQPAFEDRTLTVSHLCHNAGCLNPSHVVLEPLDVNKGRNGCPAGAHCHHKVRCLRPGPSFDA